MVSELESEGAYYAIERVRCGLYTLCKLGSWVNMKDLRASALIARSDGTTVKPNPPRPCGQTDWWNLAVIGPADAPREDVSKRLKTNDQLSIQLKMKPPISEVYPTTSKSRRLSAAMESDTIAGMPTLPFSTPADLQEAFEPNAQEIFKMLRSQYLDTLYLSKVRIARPFMTEKLTEG